MCLGLPIATMALSSALHSKRNSALSQDVLLWSVACMVLQEIVRILETHLLNQSEVYGVTFSSVMSDDLKSIKSEVATKGTQEAMCRCVMEFLWEQPEDAMLPRDPRERPVARIFSQEQQLGDMGEGGGLQFPKTVMVDAVDLASNSDPQTPATQHWDRCLHPLSHSEKLEVGHTIQEKVAESVWASLN